MYSCSVCNYKGVQSAFSWALKLLRIHMLVNLTFNVILRKYSQNNSRAHRRDCQNVHCVELVLLVSYAFPNEYQRRADLLSATVNNICILSVTGCSYPEYLSVKGETGVRRML